MSNSDIIKLEKSRDFYKAAFKEAQTRRIELEAENRRLKDSVLHYLHLAYGKGDER